MPAELTTMHQVREIVRLHQAGVSTREIGIRVGVEASTTRLTLRQVEAAGSRPMPCWKSFYSPARAKNGTSPLSRS